MSLLQKIEKGSDNTTKRDIMLLDMLRNLIKEVEQITEFNESELKALSLVETDQFLADLLIYYKANKKHVKRKYSAEIREVIDKIAQTAQMSSMSSNFQGGG